MSQQKDLGIETTLQQGQKKGKIVGLDRARFMHHGSVRRLSAIALGLVTGLTPAIFSSRTCFGQKLIPGSSFASGDCYGHLDGAKLTIGNARIRRTWQIEKGRLFATSLFDTNAQVEWINVKPALPSPTPPQPDAVGTVEMYGSSGRFGPTESESLRIELRQRNNNALVKYEFQIFPNASGVRIWVESEASKPSTLAENTPVGDSKPGIEDALEHLQIAQPHLRLTQVVLRDRTDEQNELVFENEWLLHPNEARLALPGNIFFLENTITGDGLLFLKEAPLPEMRPIKTKADLYFSGFAMSERKTTNLQPAYFDISFYGHGYKGDGKGYPYALITYHGGRTGRIAAVHQYQRQIRQYVPVRDGMLLSNTWGDRSADAKLNEAFIRNEIDRGRELGVDIVQIDEGWQAGKAMGMTGVGASGIWEGFWRADPKFWVPNVSRFPRGIGILADYAHAQGMKLGLWFAPDSYRDFENWRKDANEIEQWHHDDHVDAFKLDSVNIKSKLGESNYRSFTDEVLRRSSGNVLLDLDVTAGTRQGYFGNIPAGTIFVENRYSDWHRYWPHQTLRNFWKLAQYVDPIRLRMEFLNQERSMQLYMGDPLAPNLYRPSTLFAITMLSSPLAWFENTGLSSSFVADASPLIRRWKEERESMYNGSIIPIGEVPDGTKWTGFVSISSEQKSGYFLIFRELSSQTKWTFQPPLLESGKYRIEVIGGQGDIVKTSDGFEVTIPQALGFVWAKVEALP